MLLIGLFAGMKAGSRFVSRALIKYLIPAILTLGGGYFLVSWALKAEGSSSIHEYISISVGVVVPLLLMLTGFVLEKLEAGDSRFSAIFPY